MLGHPTGSGGYPPHFRAAGPGRPGQARWHGAGPGQLGGLADPAQRLVATLVLERATELGLDLTDWEDTARMHASLAKSRSRLGDYRGGGRPHRPAA